MAGSVRLLELLPLVSLVALFVWTLARSPGSFTEGQKRVVYPLFGLFIGMEFIGLLSVDHPFLNEPVQWIAEAVFLGSVGYGLWTRPTSNAASTSTPATMDSLAEPILEIDPETRRIVRANRAARFRLGSGETLRGCDLDDFLPSGESFRKTCVQLREGGSIREETRVEPLSGDPFFAELSLNHDDERDRLLILLRDVSRHKRRARKLAEREDRYRRLFEDSPVALWEEDYSEVMAHLEELRSREGIEDFDQFFRENPEELEQCAPLLNVKNVNQKALELYGVDSVEEFRERRNPPLGEKRRKNFRTHLLSLLDGETEVRYVSETETKHGRLLHRRLRLTVAPGYEDDLSKVFVSCEDLTSRKRAEEELKQSQEFLRALLDANPHKIFVKDWHGRFMMANRSLQAFLGVPEEEIVGKTDFDFFDDQTAREIREMDRSVFREGQTKAFTTNVTSPADGERYWHRDVKVPLFQDRPPEKRLLMGIGTDVTARHHTRQELRRALDEKETLLKEVHHRVRNNLQVISSLLGLEKRRRDDEELTRILSRCRSRVLAMALVHRELYERGDLSEVYFPDYVEELARTLVEMYSTPPEDVELDVDVGEVELDLDTVIPCGLIVNELVTNALTHAFEEGRGTLRIRIRERGNGNISMLIADDGVGGDPSQVLDSGDSLGMRLVTNLVENQLKGTIEVESDGGMTFRIVFPREP